MRCFLLAGIVSACALMAGSTAPAAAKTRNNGQTLDSSTRALYAQAWRECYANFSGYRGPAGSNIALPAFESCFKQKTGRYPFQVLRQ